MVGRQHEWPVAICLLLLLLTLTHILSSDASDTVGATTVNIQHISPATTFPNLGHQLRWTAATSHNTTTNECELATDPQYRLVLQGLAASAGYELRLSYLGTLPYRFRLEFDTPALTTSSDSHHRKLLDTEKVIFHTDDRGHVVTKGQDLGSEPTVILSAHLYSYTLPSTACIYKRFATTIQLEQLYLQAIQPIVLRVVPLLLVALALMLWLVRPLLKSIMLSSVEADSAKQR